MDLGALHRVTCCVLAAALVIACGGLAESDPSTSDAGVDASAPPPALDAGLALDAATSDAPSCFDASPDSSVACADRPVVDCPEYDGMPSLGAALSLVVNACKKCIGSWTCGWFFFDVDSDGCITPPVFSHPGNEPFMACVRTALASVRFTCASGAPAPDAESPSVAIDSCTK